MIHGSARNGDARPGVPCPRLVGRGPARLGKGANCANEKLLGIAPQSWPRQRLGWARCGVATQGPTIGTKENQNG